MGCGVSSDSIENIILPINGQFEKKELIGVGSCGRVYRCINQANNQQYAMKVIDSEANRKVSNRQEQSFKGLISQSRQLHRDLIASYYDIQRKDNEIRIVMELSKQGTLKKFIQQNGKLTDELISKITAQILEGMCYLHNAGIIHRDLKSSNVLYFKEERVKLADYGLEDYIKIAPTNKRQKYKELDFSRGQSLRYSAPQIIKQEQPSYKSDIWSLGCIVIEMITGQAPWININSKFEAVFDSIVKLKAVVLPKNISEQCKSFLNKCLEVSPQKRATTYELFSHPFVQKFISKQNNSIQQSKAQAKKTLEKSDLPNRMTPSKKDEAQFGKSPSSIQRNIKKDNSPSPQSYKLYQSQKFDSQNKRQFQGENQLNRLKQVVNNFGKIKKSKDKKSIYNDDILPQILQDEQHTVILNNKKVHLKNNQSKFKTQQSSTIAPRAQSSALLEQNDSFLSINSNNRYRIKSKPYSNFNDSFSNESRIKVETEPILMANDLQKDPQYFKKPLKLLKRKLKQRKNNNNINYHSGNQIGLKEEDLNPTNSRQIDEQIMIHSSKIRTISQQSNEQVVIHTQLAKAERDRYLRQQIFMKKQKQQQKRQWENELQKQAETIKQQFAHRYAYKKFRPLII